MCLSRGAERCSKSGRALSAAVRSSSRSSYDSFMMRTYSERSTKKSSQGHAQMHVALRLARLRSAISPKKSPGERRLRVCPAATHSSRRCCPSSIACSSSDSVRWTELRRLEGNGSCSSSSSLSAAAAAAAPACRSAPLACPTPSRDGTRTGGSGMGSGCAEIENLRGRWMAGSACSRCDVSASSNAAETDDRRRTIARCAPGGNAEGTSIPSGAALLAGGCGRMAGAGAGSGSGSGCGPCSPGRIFSSSSLIRNPKCSPRGSGLPIPPAALAALIV
mmetsp:Transcript_12732/g.41987  ORF Transcript_12732/g.41987 Transcript_12732/m.41987 type:complete len:277 (+) Transcript_12732:533-1363(+)